MKRKIVIGIIILIVFVFGSKVIASDEWKDISTTPSVKTLSDESKLMEIMNKLYEADTSTMSEEDKKKYANILNDWIENSKVKENYKTRYAYYGELKQRVETLSTYLKKVETNVQNQQGNEDLKQQEQNQYVPDNSQKHNTQLESREGTKPREDIFANYDSGEKTSPDEIINDGIDFLKTGKNNQGFVFIKGNNVENTSDMLFNVLFSVGIGISLLIGIYLGIKLIVSSVEDKANIKEALLPYFIGVIIMLSSFSIWKLILVLLQSIDNIG